MCIEFLRSIIFLNINGKRKIPIRIDNVWRAHDFALFTSDIFQIGAKPQTYQTREQKKKSTGKNGTYKSCKIITTAIISIKLDDEHTKKRGMKTEIIVSLRRC